MTSVFKILEESEIKLLVGTVDYGLIKYGLDLR
jgi:hypothetical protein